MTDYSMESTPFRVGKVLSRSLSTYFRNIVPFVLIALVISSPTYVYTILAGPTETVMSDNPLEYWSNVSIRPFVVFLVDFLLGNLIAAALVYGTIQDIKRQPATLGDCFSRGIALMLPVFGVAFVLLLILFLVAIVTVFPGAIVIGLIANVTESTVIGYVGAPFLLIPMIYVWVMLWVTIPVAVIERRGLGSLKRSRELTKGSRWRVFGLLFLLFAVSLAIGTLIGLITGIVSSMDPTQFAGQVAMQWLISGLVGALSAVISAVSYHDLRVAKEGVDTDQIALVFD